MTNISFGSINDAKPSPLKEIKYEKQNSQDQLVGEVAKKNLSNQKTKRKHPSSALQLPPSKRVKKNSMEINDLISIKLNSCEKRINKEVLCSRSEKFERIFAYGIQESKTGSLTLLCEGLGEAQCHKILDYFETGKIEINGENVLLLLRFADEHFLREMVESCLTFIQKNMSEENRFEITKFAYEINSDALKAIVLSDCMNGGEAPQGWFDEHKEECDLLHDLTAKFEEKGIITNSDEDFGYTTLAIDCEKDYVDTLRIIGKWVKFEYLRFYEGCSKSHLITMKELLPDLKGILVEGDSFTNFSEVSEVFPDIKNLFLLEAKGRSLPEIWEENVSLKLYLENCNGFYELETNAKEVKIDGCPNIQKLKAPRARVINTKYCAGLESINTPLAKKEVVVENCPNLKDFKSHGVSIVND